MGIAALFRRLGEILVHERLTTPDVVERALLRSRTTGERVGEALVALGAIKDDDVLRALALSAGVTIYVAASDLIPEVNREGGPALGWTVFAGLVLFVIADWLVSPLGGH